MTKVIVVSFKEEAKAMAAMHKLNELDGLGDISIYEKTMVRKKGADAYETLKEDGNEGWRTLTGMALGGMLGAIGGPVGFVIGLYTGTAIGAMTDISHYDFKEDFIAAVENKMAVGTISIIAEIDENSDVFVDTSLASMGAEILRSDIDFEFDNYVSEQVGELETAISVERKKLKKASAAEKEKIAKEIAALKEIRKQKIADLEAKANKAVAHTREKAASGMEKMKTTVKEFADGITHGVNEEKATLIKNRIARHENKLRHLKAALKEVEA